MGSFILLRSLRKGLLVGLVATLAAWSAPSYAGGHHVLIDFNFPSPNNANGEAWVFSSAECIPAVPPPATPPGFASCVLDFSTPTAIANSTAAVPLGFNVKIGSTTYSSVHPSEFGVLTFVTALTSFTQEANFDALTALLGTANPFIAAFYPSEAFVIPTASDPAGISNGGAEYGRGEANPSGTAGVDNTDLSGDVAAFKATWFDDNGGGSIPNTVGTRIVIYNRASGGADGDFDLRIEYSGTYNDGSGKNGIVGFRLGSDTNKVVVSSSITAPTVVTDILTDYYYQFRNGQLVGSVTKVAVPNVVNATQAAATTLIQNAGLILGPVTTQSSSTIALGRVISQNPASGVSVDSGSAVSLVVSSGVAVIRGDVNRDGQVDVLDLALILQAFNKHVGPNDARDLNRDGIVNLRDAVILVQLCTHPLCARKGH
jgi:hypothetical protein